MKKLYMERFKSFSSLEKLEQYAMKNKIAMIGVEDNINLKFGTTCQFYAIKEFVISHPGWSIYSQKNSPYIPLINYRQVTIYFISMKSWFIYHFCYYHF